MKILKKSDALILFNFQENWRVWFNVLQFLWPRVHEISQKSDALIFLNFHDPGGTWKSTKIRRFNFHKKSDALILIMIFVDFHVLGHESWRKLNCLIFEDFHVSGVIKIESSDFWGFSCTRGHENWRKLNCLIFEDFHDPRYMKTNKNQTLHENSQKSDNSIFFNFYDKRYMKIIKNLTLRFSSIFMTPGTWKLTKIRRFNFLQLSFFSTDFCRFSCTPGVMKVEENQSVWFLWKFILPK